MSQELIATWLGLEAGEWPPNHYRLLGLKPGEGDASLIEERVHQRLDMVRRYQMMYPDQATEAMNLIAQAFVCLTDPAAKKVYDLDRGLNGAVAPVAPVAGSTAVSSTAPVAPTAEAADADEPVVVLYNPADDVLPPPVIVPYDETLPPPVALVVPDAELPPVTLPVEVPGPHVPLPPPVVPGRRAVRRALYKRMARMRRLLDHWNAAGKYLATPKRRVTSPAEAKDLLLHLTGVRDRLPELSVPLGQAGQAGYHVLTLAQLNSVPTFQTLAPQQREVLGRDWHDGQKVLEDQRIVLRVEIRALRRQSTLQRVGRNGVRFVKGHPGAVLAALAVLSLVVVLFRTFVFDWLPRGH